MNVFNVSVSRRSSATLLVGVLLLCTMIACAKTTKRHNLPEDIQLSPEIYARLDALDTELEIPEGFTKEDKIAYIENYVLTSPISVIELLALQPIHTLDPAEHYWEYISDAGWDKIRLMNRFMRMQLVAIGDPMDELRWVEAVQITLDAYATSYDITPEQAVDSIASASEYLCGGTQYEMNQCAYVLSSVEYYKTLAAYKDFIEQMSNNLQSLFYDEYIAWNKMNKARHNAYVNIVRADDHYSALPMELEAMYSAYAEKRTQLLDIEKQILFGGETYYVQHPVVRTANWKRYLQSLRKKCVDDEALAIVLELDETTRTWIAIRQNIAKTLPPAIGTSYDNVTADYHWAITNEEEHIVGMYD